MNDPARVLHGEAWFLMTSFGTLLSIDASTGRLVHRSIGDEWGDVQPVRLRRGQDLVGHALSDAVGRALPEGGFAAWRFTPAARTRHLWLTDGATFVTAAQSGKVSSQVTVAREFENFLPVPASDAAFLHDILQRSWRVGETSPARLGFARGAILLDGVACDLAANLPFEPRCTRDRLVLRGADGDIVARRVATPRGRPVIWIQPLGNIGNRALQYLTAAGIRAHVPEAEIRNVKLEMWGIDIPAPRPRVDRCAGAARSRLGVDVQGIAACLRRGDIDAFLIEAFTFRVDHYPSREVCRALLPSVPGTEEVAGFGPDTLLCSIRGREILRGVHRNYFPLPTAYYEMLRRECGLKLVFFGQLGDDPYTASLRQAFPDAEFVAGRGEAQDFETIRRSSNVALSISTFAWLAAWLGHAERVYLPVGGMFSPVQQPAQLYIPYGEASYRYVLLPPAEAQSVFHATERFFRMQAYLGEHARFVGEAELREIHARVGTFDRHAPVRVAAFDRQAYLRSNLDAAIDERALKRTALAHYLETGAAEGRAPCRFDKLSYGRNHPDAAEAVARGVYPTLLAHYLATGAECHDLPHEVCGAGLQERWA